MYGAKGAGNTFLKRSSILILLRKYSFDHTNCKLNPGTSDKALILAIRAGDKDSFELLYRRYSIKMYRQAYAILNDEEEAKDITQEVFTNLWHKINDIDLSSDSIFPYLYIAIKHTVFKKLERIKLQRKHQDHLMIRFDELDLTTLDQLSYSEMKHKLDQAISSLPSKMKVVFQMSRDQQLTHKEIAERLKISDKTVKKQINNAIKLIKKELHITGSIAIIALLLTL